MTPHRLTLSWSMDVRSWTWRCSGTSSTGLPVSAWITTTSSMVRLRADGRNFGLDMRASGRRWRAMLSVYNEAMTEVKWETRHIITVGGDTERTNIEGHMQQKYPWEEWFERRRVVLMRGEDYRCSQSTMAQTIRNAAS